MLDLSSWHITFLQWEIGKKRHRTICYGARVAQTACSHETDLSYAWHQSIWSWLRELLEIVTSPALTKLRNVVYKSKHPDLSWSCYLSIETLRSYACIMIRSSVIIVGTPSE